MTADVTSTTKPDFVTTLSETVATYREGSNRPQAEVVVNALLQAEKTTKQQRLNYPFESLVGQWQLCFVTGTKNVRQRGGIILGKGLYVPKFVAIHISFIPSLEKTSGKGAIANQVKLGSLVLQLTGPAQYLGKKNLLAFDFTQMQISLFGRVLVNRPIRTNQVQTADFYHQPIAKLPFFAFFLVTGDLIAARGRGGGLAIWMRKM